MTDSTTERTVVLLQERLSREGHTLMVENAGEIFAGDRRGVADLHHLLSTRKDFLHGAVVVDKVIGKGAAALLCAGGAKRVHTGVISRPAIQLLEAYGVPVTYELLVDNIVNRQGTGICPVESLCLNCTTAEECLPLIDRFLESLPKN